MHNSQITVFLNEEEENKKLTQSFLSYVGQPFELPGFVVPPPFRLVRSVYCNEYRIISDDPIPKTLFFIRLFELSRPYQDAIRKIPIASKNTTQCLVWSSMVPGHEDAFHYLATKFFEYFLTKFNIAISPGEMTICGAHFWEGRLLWSFTRNDTHVHRIDDVLETPVCSEITNWIDFQPHWSEFLWASVDRISNSSLILITQDRPKD